MTRLLLSLRDSTPLDFDLLRDITRQLDSDSLEASVQFCAGAGAAGLLVLLGALF